MCIRKLCATLFLSARSLEFDEIVKTVKEAHQKIVQNLQNKNAEVKIEKITEVYLKEEEEPFTEFVDQKEEEEPITESVDQKDALQRSKGEKFACDECGAVLSSDKIRQSHKKNLHGDKLFPCDQCDYKTKRTNGLMVLNYTKILYMKVLCHINAKNVTTKHHSYKHHSYKTQ